MMGAMPADTHALYDDLRARLRRAHLLSSSASVLHWDEQTQMPKGGLDARAEQLALLSRLAHEASTDPRVGELIETLGGRALPDEDARDNVRLLQRDFDKASKLPADFVEALSKLETKAHAAWAEARKADDFAAFQPWLEQVVQRKREQADLYGHAGERYDALLDDYEPGATTAEVAQTFAALRGPLAELVQRASERPRHPKLKSLDGGWDVAQQAAFAADAARQIGFDFARGRIDVSVHPFCTGITDGDTRITTRYSADSFEGSFYGVLHEVGHALYEQGLPKATHPGLPLGEAAGLGTHESQSRLWENLVGRSAAFWKHFLPEAKAAFGARLDGVDLPLMLAGVNDVRPSLIRTESDEVTYNLHVLLRFELETKLLRGELDVADVPAAWDAAMKTLLGVDVPDAARGCLQDVHWSHGLFGYFPTYTLGNLYGAQYFEAARRDLGDLDGQFAAGDFQPLLGWLRDKVHRHGRRHSAAQLCERATGRPLEAAPLLTHLTAKVEALGQ